MFKLKKTSRFLLGAIFAAGIVSCEEDGDFTIPQGNVEVVNPREEVIVVTDITLTSDNQFQLEGSSEPVSITAKAPESVTRVAFFRGDELLGEDTEVPYTVDVDVSDATAFNNVNIVAKGYSDGVESGEQDIPIFIGKRVEAEAGDLVGDGNEQWNPNPEDDGVHIGMANFDGEGDLELASGVNIPLTLQEAGDYKVFLALASGWGDGRTAFVYFDDDVESAEEVEIPVVDPTWVDFQLYEAPGSFTLTEGDHTIKYRKGQTYVHFDYLVLYKIASED